MPVQGSLCRGCALEEKGEIFIPADGLGTSKVLLVGDAGDIYGSKATRACNGSRVGTPLVGPSGWFIERNLKRIGSQRAHFTIANSYWCKAPYPGFTDHAERYPEAVLALNQCRPYLDDLIQRTQPKAIVPMGNVALRRITGCSGIERHHAYYMSTPYGIPAIPTFHPSYILKGNAKLSGLWCYAVKRALDVALKAERPKQYDLLLDPPLDEARRYLSWAKQGPLVCDIETPMSDDVEEDERDDASYTIVRISFSVAAGSAISLPWQPPYIALIRDVLANCKELVFWNQNYDLPRLRANGCNISARVVDAMFSWHWLQSDLPKALGFVAPLFVCVEPWKQMANQEPARYSALDSAITMDTYLGIKAQLESEGRWKAFERHCVEMFPVLDRMSGAGVMLDLEHQGQFKKRLEGERDLALAKLQEQVPDEVKPTKVYKRKPKDMTDVINCDVESGEKIINGWVRILPFNPGSPLQVKKLITHLGLPIPKAKGEDRESTEAKHLKSLARKNKIFGTILDYRERDKLISSYMWESKAEEFIEIVWVEAKVEGLQDQVLQEKSGCQGDVRKPLSKGVAGQDTLRASWVGCTSRSWEEMPYLPQDKIPAYHPSLGHGYVKQYSKELPSSLCFVPHHISPKAKEFGSVLLPFKRKITLGKITSQFSFHPSTWRKSARNPNVQTVPKRNDLAAEFRRMIVARPGHVLVECDSSAIEAVLVGFFANSPRYMELAKRGVHKWLAQEYAQRPVSKTEPLYDQIKRVVHLSNYMGSPQRIHEEYSDVFASVKEARTLQDFYFATPAGQDIKKWHQQVLERAHKERFLENPYRYRHYFYSVFQYSNGQWVLGDDAKRAVAFLPQSTASALQTEFVLEIESSDPALAETLRWLVHDSIICEVPLGTELAAAKKLKNIMEMPHPLLGGLVIGAEVKIGPNLRDMEVVE
jgi:uracil-DNA glycosylase family 4